jgi:diguanylate cyclase (GGDEF)-like protein
MLDPRWRRLARLRGYCNSACIVPIAVGCLVLFGWVFHIASLKSGFLNSSTMKANTCLGLIFLGISLWMLLPDPPRKDRRAWGLFFAAIPAAIGALTVIEYASGLDLRFDQLLFREDAGAIASYSPGRMSPVTATTLLALGLALLLLDWEPKPGRRPAQWLTLWGMFVGIMSLSGYINGATAVFRIFSYTQVAVFTALLLLVMSVAIFLARPKVGMAGDLTGSFMGSAMARRFLPAAVIVPMVAAWLRVRGQRAGLFGTELGLSLNVTLNVVTLSLLLWLNARHLNRAEESLDEERKVKDALYDASLKDELTGVYNRRGFLTFAEEHVKLASSGRRQILVVFADVDGLKAINDGYGHQEGDRALKKTAEVLLTVFRDTDVVGRMGGDEFAVLALDCSPAGLVRINAHLDKLLRAASKADNPWKLSISVGAIHVHSEHPLSIVDLLTEADKVMYQQKRSRVLVAPG